jgi:hypothetical protein
MKEENKDRNTQLKSGEKQGVDDETILFNKYTSEASLIQLILCSISLCIISSGGNSGALTSLPSICVALNILTFIYIVIFHDFGRVE